jgi:hypothetical protein
MFHSQLSLSPFSPDLSSQTAAAIWLYLAPLDHSKPLLYPYQTTASQHNGSCSQKDTTVLSVEPLVLNYPQALLMSQNYKNYIIRKYNI